MLGHEILKIIRIYLNQIVYILAYINQPVFEVNFLLQGLYNGNSSINYFGVHKTLCIFTTTDVVKGCYFINVASFVDPGS